MAESPEVMEIGKHVYIPENGKLRVPDLPGIGQELSEKAMAKAIGYIKVE